MAQFTTRKEIELHLSTLRSTFCSGRTKDIRYRKWQLKQLYWLVFDNMDALISALQADLSSHEFEARFMLKDILDDLAYHIDQVEIWAKDEIPDSGFIYTKLGKTIIRHEPRGVAFIIGAWNYPYSLTLKPFASAIAAGCCALIKPSEVAAHTAELMINLASKYLDSEAYAFVSGGASETEYMLTHKFDHVFFTGSTRIGKNIAAAAAKHLTPTVLELGGQGPAIVTKTANVDLAAKRILAAKFMNAGQICLTVNHAFVHPDIHDQFLERIKYWNEQFTHNGEENGISTIINEQHHARLTSMLEQTSGTVVCGGTLSRTNSLTIPPTVVSNASMSDSLLTQELFGPILPIIPSTLTSACSDISSLPHPLALYIFSQSQSEINHILDHTLSGGVTINDCFLHAGAPNVPFGGVGDSGYGNYHGKYGFDAFTHKRTVVQLPNWLDRVMTFRYPPYDVVKAKSFITPGVPKFMRGERLEDQKIGRPWSVLGVACIYLAGVGIGAALYSGRVGWLIGYWRAT